MPPPTQNGYHLQQQQQQHQAQPHSPGHQVRKLGAISPSLRQQSPPTSASSVLSSIAAVQLKATNLRVGYSRAKCPSTACANMFIAHAAKGREEVGSRARTLVKTSKLRIWPYFSGGYSGKQWAAAFGREPDLHHSIQRQQRWRRRRWSAASSATASRLFKRR